MAIITIFPKVVLKCKLSGILIGNPSELFIATDQKTVLKVSNILGGQTLITSVPQATC